MSWFKSEGIAIEGVAAAVPSRLVRSRDYMERFGQNAVEKFEKSVGVLQTHRTEINQTASDLGYAAANHLLEHFHIDRSKIGVLVFVTLSPDYRRPATSCVLQKRLNLSEDCASIDVSQGCSGFVYGQMVIESLMMASQAEYGLLIQGETVSKLLAKDDRSSMLFSDAGSAVLYGKKDNCTHYTQLHTDGKGFKHIVLPAGGFREMDASKEKVVCSDGVARSKYDLFMDGMSVFSFSVTSVPTSIREFLEKTGTSMEDYDRAFFHQANLAIVNQLTKKFKLSKEKVPFSLDRHGNTSGVSIPLTMCDYYGERSGVEKVLACGFGVGLSWGVTAMEIDADKVLPIIETDVVFDEGIIDLHML